MFILDFRIAMIPIFIKLVNRALPGTCSGGTNTDSHAKHTKIEDGM